MATPSYPQEDKEERRAPCLAPNFCNTSRIDPWKWRDHAALSNWWRMQKNIVTLWLVCGHSQLPSDEAKRRHNANSLYMKLMMLESTNRHPFFWGGGHGIIGQIPPSEPCVSIRMTRPSHRERAASKEFRSISIPGRVTSEALRLLHCFCTVFDVLAEDRSCYYDPLGKCTCFFWTQRSILRFRRRFSFSLGWFLVRFCVCFRGCHKQPFQSLRNSSIMSASNSCVYAILRSKKKKDRFTPTKWNKLQRLQNFWSLICFQWKKIPPDHEVRRGIPSG